MTDKIYFQNTLTREKEEFIPITSGQAGVYSCGPTVYDYVHIGNIRSYILADTLRRVLEFAGYKVNHVINITDVGHLVSDDDDGEDKMEVGKQREGLDAWAIAQKYTDAFLDHIDKTGIKRPHVLCRATDHIPEQIEMIKTLEAKGYTYSTGDGIYFDTEKFGAYGEMAKLDIDGLQEGSRVVSNDKRNKTDFALWKFSPEGQKRDMEWESPWGLGFPGWHIECSAMSMKYLGDQFDIHTGGIDHIPIHHTNEIAQSEACTGHAPFVRYWLHNEFLNLGAGVKMSKSSGNFITIDTLIEKGYDPLAFRYLLLTSHYRNSLKFTFDSLDAAVVAFGKLNNAILECKKQADDTVIDITGLSDVARGYFDRFKECAFNDLNTAMALDVLRKMLHDNDVTAVEKYSMILKYDEILGLGFAKVKEISLDIPDNVQNLISARETARQNKEWDASDRIRQEIEDLGFLVKDSRDGYKIVKI